MNIMLQQVFQQVYNVSVVGDGKWDACRLLFFDNSYCLFTGFGYCGHPALIVAGHDAGDVHFGHDGCSARDLGSFALGAAHVAQSGGYEKTSGQVLILGYAKLETTGIKQCIKGSVDNALRSDIHPAAGCHLAVIGDADSSSSVEAVVVVEHADHKGVGGDHTRRQLM